MKTLAAVVFALSLVACRSSTEPAPARPTIAGTWSGIASNGLAVTLVLTQAGDSVHGGGAVVNPAVTPTPSWGITGIDGSYTSNAATAFLVCHQGTLGFTFEATIVTTTSMSGLLGGDNLFPSVAGITVTLTKR